MLWRLNIVGVGRRMALTVLYTILMEEWHNVIFGPKRIDVTWSFPRGLGPECLFDFLIATQGQLVHPSVASIYCFDHAI